MSFKINYKFKEKYLTLAIILYSIKIYSKSANRKFVRAKMKKLSFCQEVLPKKLF